MPFSERRALREAVRRSLSGGRGAGSAMCANRLKIHERRFRSRKARHRCGHLQCQLRRRLKDRNATGVAGLAIVVVGPVPVECRVKAQQANGENERDAQ